MPARRISGLLVALAACGQPAGGVNVPSHRGPPVPLTLPAITTDAQALELWRSLAPTWSSWRTLRKQIHHEQARPLARALLRGGNFACPARKRSSCHPDAIGDPEPGAGFDDPCMRRMLATWALHVLSEDEIAELGEATLVPLAGLPAPERRINSTVIEKVSTAAPEKLLPLLVAARRSDALDPSKFEIDVRRMPPDKQRAALASGLYKSSVDVDPVADRASLLDEMANPRVDTIARSWAIAKAVEPTPPGAPLPPVVRDEIAKLLGDRECDVAVSAAFALAAHGEPQHLPRRPTTASLPANLRILCMAAARVVTTIDDPKRRSDLLLAYHVPGGELVVTDRRPDSRPPERHTRSKPLSLEGDYVLPSLLHACTGTHCDSGLHAADLTFTPAPDGGLYLTAIDVQRGRCAGAPSNDDTHDEMFDEMDDL
jgi:hypothetical protein